MKRVTMADVARQAGVGVATVDRVVNGRTQVKPATAEKVLEAAEALGFRATNLIRARVDSAAQERRLGFILQKRTAPFYRLLARALSEATRRSTEIRGVPVVEYLEELTPRAIVEKLELLEGQADAIALVAADHPRVREAVDRVVDRGTPVVTLLSDLPSSLRVAHIGIDNRMAGRTAAWTITRLNPKPGKVGILVGSHRYECQELCEASFRSYIRENAPHFEIVEAMISLEDPALAQEATLDLLERHPDLVGIYVAGGGVEGVIQALRDAPEYRQLVTVCNELTDQTREALIDGLVDLVISHPRDAVAARAVAMMVRGINDGGQEDLGRELLPFDLNLSENVY